MSTVGEELTVPFVVGDEVTPAPGRPELPHFAQSFAIDARGAAVVEQDSTADKAACVFRVAVCPHGFRDDLPSFGIPQLLRKSEPLDVPALQAALGFWEPRADLTITEQVESLSAAVSIEIDVS